MLHPAFGPLQGSVSFIVGHCPQDMQKLLSSLQASHPGKEQPRKNRVCASVCPSPAPSFTVLTAGSLWACWHPHEAGSRPQGLCVPKLCVNPPSHPLCPLLHPPDLTLSEGGWSWEDGVHSSYLPSLPSLYSSPPHFSSRLLAATREQLWASLAITSLRGTNLCLSHPRREGLERFLELVLDVQRKVSFSPDFALSG